MKTLAIEQSTRTGSVALLGGEDIAGEMQWENENLRSQAIFSAIPEILSDAAWTIGDVDLFAVGLGPGSFAGVRTALAAAEGFAMVDRKPILGIGSGEAIAADLFEADHEGPIAVVGDARRQRVWVAVFERGKNSPRQRVPYTLMTAEQLKQTLAETGSVATPDWDRIGDLLAKSLGASTELVRQPCVPSATTIGRLAIAALSPGTSLPLPQPIYLHPAVFVKPKYPRIRGSI